MKLIRDVKSSSIATMGRLYADALPVDVFTLERPWIPVASAPCGAKGRSCVPPGLYRLVPHNSEAHPMSVALVNEDLWVYHFEEEVPAARRVLARTCVLIHPANYVAELRGCIAPGLSRRGDTVSQSRSAYYMLQDIGWPSTIEIVEHPRV